MKEIRVYYVDAFTSEPFKGNAAGVVLDGDLLSSEDMQNIAKEINLPETVFLLPAASEGTDFRVRYFSPTDEINFCGHATIGLSWVLLNELGYKDSSLNSIIFETNIGPIPVVWNIENDELKNVEMTQIKPSVKEIQVNPAQLSDLIGVKEQDIDATYPIKLANTGNWHLLIPIVSTSAINSAAPNLSALADYNKKMNISTTHLFTFHTEDDHDIYTRDFAPAIGIPEDPVTGAANGALAGYLYSEQLISNTETSQLKIGQGNAIKRPGTLYLSVIPDIDGPMIKVAGTAVITLRGTIHL